MSGYLNQSDGGEEMINLNEILHRLVADYSELGEVVGLTMAGSKQQVYKMIYRILI